MPTAKSKNTTMMRNGGNGGRAESSTAIKGIGLGAIAGALAGAAAAVALSDEKNRARVKATIDGLMEESGVMREVLNRIIERNKQAIQEEMKNFAWRY